MLCATCFPRCDMNSHVVILRYPVIWAQVWMLTHIQKPSNIKDIYHQNHKTCTVIHMLYPGVYMEGWALFQTGIIRGFSCIHTVCNAMALRNLLCLLLRSRRSRKFPACVWLLSSKSRRVCRCSKAPIYSLLKIEDSAELYCFFQILVLKKKKKKMLEDISFLILHGRSWNFVEHPAWCNSWLLCVKVLCFSLGFVKIFLRAVQKFSLSSTQ